MCAGVWLADYLSVKTFIAKVSGVVLASGAGMVHGLEGPYAHIAALIAHMMCKIPFFKYVVSLWIAFRMRRGITACVL